MTSEILQGALTFPVPVFGGLLQHPRALCSGLLELGVHVADADLDLMRDSARLRGLLFAADVRDGHRTILADLHLRAMIFTDPNTLDEAEGPGEPGHRSTHVRVHQHGITVADGIERFVSIEEGLGPPDRRKRGARAW